MRDHFFRLKYWRVKISNAEAVTWGGVEMVVLILTLATLLWFGNVGGVTAGSISAILSFVWMLMLPNGREERS